MLRDQMLQTKISDKNLKKAKDETKGSFYEVGCGIDTIFEREVKIMSKNMKCTIKLCGNFGHNNFASKNC